MIQSRINPSWRYQHFNDDEIIQFFNENPHPEFPQIIERFDLLNNGAHKADLFRYYYLYLRGGVFMDSDAMIYRNINQIIKDYSFFSVNSTAHPGSIFQGIIGAEANNPIIYMALQDAYEIDLNLLKNNYHQLCRNLYKIIHTNSFDFKIKLYRELRENTKGDRILDDDQNVIFMHYWKDKKIPRHRALPNKKAKKGVMPLF